MRGLLIFFLGEDHITLEDKKGTVSTGDAMAVVWYRLHNQSTLREAQNVLGYDESKLSAILKQAFFRISGFFAHLERPRWITDGRRDFYRASLAERNIPEPTVIGFIDGVRFDIARPKHNQVVHYSGYTKTHNLLFLAITFPDGSQSVRGPVEGCRNDLGAMAAVGWRDRQSLQEITGEFYTIGGDGIFSCYQHTLPIVTGSEVWTGEQVRRFAACRESVEWSFNTLYQLFPVLRDWTKFRLLQTYPQYMIKTAFVLAQAYNTMYPGIVSTHFSLPPPTLVELFPVC